MVRVLCFAPHAQVELTGARCFAVQHTRSECAASFGGAPRRPMTEYLAPDRPGFLFSVLPWFLSSSCRCVSLFTVCAVLPYLNCIDPINPIHGRLSAWVVYISATYVFIFSHECQCMDSIRGHDRLWLTVFSWVPYMWSSVELSKA